MASGFDAWSHRYFLENVLAMFEENIYKGDDGRECHKPLEPAEEESKMEWNSQK